jgi:hypothetical protein
MSLNCASLKLAIFAWNSGSILKPTIPNPYTGNLVRVNRGNPSGVVWQPNGITSRYRVPVTSFRPEERLDDE